MGYGLYDYDRRYRRRLWGGITRVGFYVVTIGVAALFAYQIGVEQVAGREELLNDRIEVLEGQNRRLTGEAVRLEAQARTALAQYQEMRELYDRNLPTGVRNWLLNLVDDRLGAGIAPERIALYLDASSEPEGCTDPISRRFIMPTPNFTGDNTSVGFGEGLVTITGRGQGAVDDDGTTQAWFDPAREITLVFTAIGGERQTVNGVLPLFHTMVVGDQEFRFAVEQGDRSLVNVAGTTCPIALPIGSSP